MTVSYVEENLLQISRPAVYRQADPLRNSSKPIIIIIQVFIKRKILSVHTHTHTREHTDYTKLALHDLKRAANSETDEDSSTKWKTWQVYSLGKINVFRLHLNKSV